MLPEDYNLLCGADMPIIEAKHNFKYYFERLGGSEHFRALDKNNIKKVINMFPEAKPATPEFRKMIEEKAPDEAIIELLKKYIPYTDDLQEVYAYIKEHDLKCINDMPKYFNIESVNDSWFLCCGNLYKKLDLLFWNAIEAGCNKILMLQFDVNTLERENALKVASYIHSILKPRELPLIYYRRAIWFNHLFVRYTDNYHVQTIRQDVLNKRYFLTASLIELKYIENNINITLETEL